MINFLADYGSLILSAVFLLISVFFRSKVSNKTLEKCYMKFKTNYNQSCDVQIAQSFSDSRFKPVYRLNKVSNELEKTDEVVDIQELLNSCRDYCLSSCLDRFLPSDSLDSSVDNLVAEYDDTLDDLDNLTAALDLAEDYREKFNLSHEMSVDDIFKFVSDRAGDLKSAIEKHKSVKKGGEDGETVSE